MATKRRMRTGLLVCSRARGTAVEKGPARPTGNAATPTNSVAVRRVPVLEGLEEALPQFDKFQAEYRSCRAQQNQLHSAALFGEAGKGDRDDEVEARFEKVGKQLAELERRIARAAAAIDQIGGQRSCTVSRLYWYTDLDEAKAAAERIGRPILSLRMLGKLTDEYSCANSRFFRTALVFEQRYQRLPARQFRSALAERAAGAAGDDRLRRWPQAGAHADGQ